MEDLPHRAFVIFAASALYVVRMSQFYFQVIEESVQEDFPSVIVLLNCFGDAGFDIKTAAALAFVPASSESGEHAVEWVGNIGASRGMGKRKYRRKTYAPICDRSASEGAKALQENRRTMAGGDAGHADTEV